MHEDIQEILLTCEVIQAKIAELGEQITADYQDKTLLLLGTLKGAVPFIADSASNQPAARDRLHGNFQLWQQHRVQRRGTDSQRPGGSCAEQARADRRRYRG